MRLHELNDHVDLFVLIEGTKTFSLEDKPLYYQNNKDMFQKFNNKIRSFVIDDLEKVSGKNWEREWHTRNYINTALSKIPDIDDNSIILFSDVDEIPNPNKFYEIKFRLINNCVSKLVLCQRFFYYNFECENKEKK